jgi:hypothetical protein
VIDSRRSKLTPPEIARDWGISPAKVIAWIQSGELRAFNAATSATGRPRYLVDRTDLEEFTARRSAAPTPRAQPRRRRQPPDMIEFFPRK